VKAGYGIHSAACGRNQIEMGIVASLECASSACAFEGDSRALHSKFSLDSMLIQQNAGRNFVKKQNLACLYYGRPDKNDSGVSKFNGFLRRVGPARPDFQRSLYFDFLGTADPLREAELELKLIDHIQRPMN
jgi:hypothetical protein